MLTYSSDDSPPLNLPDDVPLKIEDSPTMSQSMKMGRQMSTMMISSPYVLVLATMQQLELRQLLL